MKKVLLFSLIFSIIFSVAAFGYETIIIDFPKNTKWNAVYYRNIGTEAILQYVPDGQQYTNWKQAVIVHSYKDNGGPAYRLSDILTAQLMRQNRNCVIIVKNDAQILARFIMKVSGNF